MDVYRQTAWCTSCVSVISQHKLVSGWGLWKQSSSLPYGPMWAWEGLYYYYSYYNRFTTLLDIVWDYPGRTLHFLKKWMWWWRIRLTIVCWYLSATGGLHHVAATQPQRSLCRAGSFCCLLMSLKWARRICVWTQSWMKMVRSAIVVVFGAWFQFCGRFH